MAQESFEFFKKEFEFTGRHARLASELYKDNEEDETKACFKRLIDLYILSAIVGCRAERKSPVDTSAVSPCSIFPEQMIKEKDKLDFIMQMILMTEYIDSKTPEECVKIAFRGAQSKEQYDNYLTLFNDYARGGLEIIYDALVVRRPEMDEQYHNIMSANIMNFMDEFCI